MNPGLDKRSRQHLVESEGLIASWLPEFRVGVERPSACGVDHDERECEPKHSVLSARLFGSVKG